MEEIADQVVTEALVAFNESVELPILGKTHHIVANWVPPLEHTWFLEGASLSQVQIAELPFDGVTRIGRIQGRAWVREALLDDCSFKTGMLDLDDVVQAALRAGAQNLNFGEEPLECLLLVEGVDTAFAHPKNLDCN